MRSSRRQNSSRRHFHLELHYLGKCQSPKPKLFYTYHGLHSITKVLHKGKTSKWEYSKISGCAQGPIAAVGPNIPPWVGERPVRTHLSQRIHWQKMGTRQGSHILQKCAHWLPIICYANKPNLIWWCAHARTHTHTMKVQGDSSGRMVSAGKKVEREMATVGEHDQKFVIIHACNCQ